MKSWYISLIILGLIVLLFGSCFSYHRADYLSESDLRSILDSINKSGEVGIRVNWASYEKHPMNRADVYALLAKVSERKEEIYDAVKGTYVIDNGIQRRVTDSLELARVDSLLSVGWDSSSELVSCGNTYFECLIPGCKYENEELMVKLKYSGCENPDSVRWEVTAAYVDKWQKDNSHDTVIVSLAESNFMVLSNPPFDYEFSATFYYAGKSYGLIGSEDKEKTRCWQIGKAK